MNILIIIYDLKNRYYREWSSKSSEGIVETEPTGGCWMHTSAEQQEHRTRNDEVSREVWVARPNHMKSACDWSPDQDLALLWVVCLNELCRLCIFKEKHFPWTLSTTHMVKHSLWSVTVENTPLSQTFHAKYKQAVCNLVNLELSDWSGYETAISSVEESSSNPMSGTVGSHGRDLHN